jgi:D-cysteine desulfhydrase
MLGLRAAELNSRVVSVRVTSEKYVNSNGMIKLIDMTNSLLHSLDDSFPMFEFSTADIDIRHRYYGERYALFTMEGMEAVKLMKEYEGIKLDGTYTGKTLAALIVDAKSGSLRGSTILFWNTLNSKDFSDAISDLNYRYLPHHFYRYFEERLQPLDPNY